MIWLTVRITGNDMKLGIGTSRTSSARDLSRAGARVRMARVALLCAPLVCSLAVQAQERAPIPESEIGHSTGQWLDLQRSGSHAAAPLPMLGAEAGYAYKRYLKSFDTPIPATFGSTIDTVGGAGGGSGPAGGLGGAN